MVTKYKAAVFIIAVMFSSIASAAYTTMTIEGVKQANGVWTAAGVMDTQGFIRQTAQVSVYNSTKNLPVVMTADVAASSVMLKGASRLLGPAALAVTAYDLYQWYSSNSITGSNGQWVYLTGDITFNELDTKGKVNCQYLSGFNTTISDCISRHKLNYPGAIAEGPITLSKYSVPNPSCSSTQCTYYYYQEFKNNYDFAFSIIWPAGTTTPHVNSRPATDSDFNSLPLIPISIISSSWGKFPSLVGYTPVTGVTFTPFSEWMGDPYFKDGSWYRDRMDISPCPTASQPTRVCVDIGPQKFEGATDPQTVPSQATGTASGSAPKQQETDFCKKNPQSIACSELGSLKDENLPVDERPVNVGYTPWGSSSAQCPSDKVIPLWDDRSFTISYSPVCQFASLLRPLVIALALLAAGFIVAGVTRKGGGDA